MNQRTRQRFALAKVAEDDQTLLVVNMASGELYTVDPANGKATVIDLGGVLVHGDGLVRISVALGVPCTLFCMAR